MPSTTTPPVINTGKIKTCDNYFIYIFLFYIFSLYYVFKKETAFIGYLFLILTYIASCGYFFNIERTGGFIANALPIGTQFAYFGMFAIFFLNIYALVRIIDTYIYVSKHKETFHFKMTTRYRKFLDHFNKSFLVGNIFLLVAVFLLSSKIVGPGNTNIIYIFFAITTICTIICVSYAHEFIQLKHNYL
jgi:hypothetical protein